MDRGAMGDIWKYLGMKECRNSLSGSLFHKLTQGEHIEMQLSAV
jgi:hypothetical protein